MPKRTGTKRYLVIKHGALGDMILATGPFAAIRRRHPKSHITLLTTEPYVSLAEQSPYFDEIWVDEKPKLLEFKKLWTLIKRLRSGQFKMVYDLQTSLRSSMYFRLMGRRKPLWSGIVEWCSHPHLHPSRARMHTIDRQRTQLRITGIKRVPKPDVSWLTSDISRFNLTNPYALLIAGGSLHRPEKRWSEEGFAAIARFLRDKGITPVFLGASAEKDTIHSIIALCSGAIDLSEQTSFADIAMLARDTVCTIGNDTGPMHIIAATGCPTITLFSEHSDPKLTAPRGPNTRFLQEEDLTELSEKDVISLLEELVDLDRVAKTAKH